MFGTGERKHRMSAVTLGAGEYLVLGTAETVGSFANLFAPVDGRGRRYPASIVNRAWSVKVTVA